MDIVRFQTPNQTTKIVVKNLPGTDHVGTVVLQTIRSVAVEFVSRTTFSVEPVDQ